MSSPLRPPPGIDPILDREAEVFSRFVQSETKDAQQLQWGRVYIGCDGQRHVQMAGGTACCETCPQSGSLVPIEISGGVGAPLTSEIPPVFGSTAGQPLLRIGSTSPPICNPTPTERALARRYQDSVGNLYDYAGNWISAGHGAPALVASYTYTSLASEIVYAKIQEVDGTPVKNILTEVPADRRCGARPIGRTFSYAVRDYALRGICDSVSCGRFAMTSYVCGIEWFLDTADPNPQVMTGPVTVVRRASDLSIVASYTIGSDAYNTSTGQDWAIDVADDGTWIVHKIPIASAGTATVDIYRFAFAGSSISYLGSVRCTNNNAGGKASAVTGLYFKQVV